MGARRSQTLALHEWHCANHNAINIYERWNATQIYQMMPKQVCGILCSCVTIVHPISLHQEMCWRGCSYNGFYSCTCVTGCTCSILEHWGKRCGDSWKTGMFNPGKGGCICSPACYVLPARHVVRYVSMDACNQEDFEHPQGARTREKVQRTKQWYEAYFPLHCYDTACHSGVGKLVPIPVASTTPFAIILVTLCNPTKRQAPRLCKNELIRNSVLGIQGPPASASNGRFGDAHGSQSISNPSLGCPTDFCPLKRSIIFSTKWMHDSARRQNLLESILGSHSASTSDDASLSNRVFWWGYPDRTLALLSSRLISTLGWGFWNHKGH